jgi:hypothetical protein
VFAISNARVLAPQIHDAWTLVMRAGLSLDEAATRLRTTRETLAQTLLAVAPAAPFGRVH